MENSTIVNGLKIAIYFVTAVLTSPNQTCNGKSKIQNSSNLLEVEHKVSEKDYKSRRYDFNLENERLKTQKNAEEELAHVSSQTKLPSQPGKKNLKPSKKLESGADPVIPKIIIERTSDEKEVVEHKQKEHETDYKIEQALERLGLNE